MDAYLDIETTGLSPYADEITVVGIGLSDGNDLRIVQLYEDISAADLRDALDGVRRVFTYNGSRFDLPFIRHRLRVDIHAMASHHDLMIACWQRGLYGGQKAVERALGLRRRLRGAAASASRRPVRQPWSRPLPAPPSVRPPKTQGGGAGEGMPVHPLPANLPPRAGMSSGFLNRVSGGPAWSRRG